MVDQQEVVMKNKSTRNKLQEIQEFYSDGRDEDILMILSKDACSLVSAAMSRSEVIKSKKDGGDSKYCEKINDIVSAIAGIELYKDILFIGEKDYRIQDVKADKLESLYTHVNDQKVSIPVSADVYEPSTRSCEIDDAPKKESAHVKLDINGTQYVTDNGGSRIYAGDIVKGLSDAREWYVSGFKPDNDPHVVEAKLVNKMTVARDLKPSWLVLSDASRDYATCGMPIRIGDIVETTTSGRKYMLIDYYQGDKRSKRFKCFTGMCMEIGGNGYVEHIPFYNLKLVK